MYKHIYKQFLVTITCILAFCKYSFSQDAYGNIGVSLENSIVQSYWHDADSIYTNSIGRTGNSILTFDTLTATPRPYYLLDIPQRTDCYPEWIEQPNPVNINSAGGCTIKIATSPSFSKCNTYPVIPNSISTPIYNLIPQKVYWYQVVDSTETIISQGIFKTLGHVRMIASHKVMNARDIGGLKCKSGKHIAYGKIFRGAALDGDIHVSGYVNEAGPIDDEDRNVLVNTLGIKTELDLRSMHDNTQSSLGSNITYDYFGINMYESFVNPTNTWEFDWERGLFNYIIKNLSKGGIYVHCSWGADRCGTVMALIEALCGVSEADIVKDWETTSFTGIKTLRHVDIPYSTSKYTIRPLFTYLKKTYGKNGETLQTQVTNWFKKKIYTSTSTTGEKSQSNITKLKNLLLEEDKRSATIIHEGHKDDGLIYTITEEQTDTLCVNDYCQLNIITGDESEHDAFCVTDYIDCSGYQYLLTNTSIHNVAICYDAEHNVIESITDTPNEDDPYSETVIFANRQYQLPEGTMYVKMNIPKHSGWTAVLSIDALLK